MFPFCKHIGNFVCAACHRTRQLTSGDVAALPMPQESVPGLELRSRTDAAGLRPGEYAQRARNPVLVHLLDERLPVSLLRQIWMNYSLEQSMPPRHQTLGEGGTNSTKDITYGWVRDDFGSVTFVASAHGSIVACVPGHPSLLQVPCCRS